MSCKIVSPSLSISLHCFLLPQELPGIVIYLHLFLTYFLLPLLEFKDDGVTTPSYSPLDVQCLVVVAAEHIFVGSPLASLKVHRVGRWYSKKRGGWLVLCLGEAVTAGIMDDSQAKER